MQTNILRITMYLYQKIARSLCNVPGRAWLLLMFLGVPHFSQAYDAPVLVNASVQLNPAKVTLSYPLGSLEPGATNVTYDIFRRECGSLEWGHPIVSAYSETTFTNGVECGKAYDYCVKRFVYRNGEIGLFSGLISAGVMIRPAEHEAQGNRTLLNRGKVVLIVDKTFALDLANEIGRLQEDLSGDGWIILRHDVARGQEPHLNPSGWEAINKYDVLRIRSLIQADYFADPENVKAVLLLGHVPVPYSGDLAHDGHGLEHGGAWPSDMFYGEMTSPFSEWPTVTGTWSDISVNKTNSEAPIRIHNLPGDGKFDQNTYPSRLELQVGRIDLYNMPHFLPEISNEIDRERELLRRYLDKDHNYRQRLLKDPISRVPILSRGLIARVQDSSGTYPLDFRPTLVQSMFAPLFGTNVYVRDVRQGYMKWFPVLTNNDYLFACGGGYGSYHSAYGVGATHRFVPESCKTCIGYQSEAATENTQHNFVDQRSLAVFSFLWGSFFPDWDVSDNLFRAPLANDGYGLTCTSSQSGQIGVLRMALGQTIGSVTQFGSKDLSPGSHPSAMKDTSYQRSGLMGDPTLRMHIICPPGVLSGTRTSLTNSVQLTWGASVDEAEPGFLGYNVYRAPTKSGPYELLNTNSPINGRIFTASPSTNNAYMVRAVKIETTPSGTYTNGSQGAVFCFSGGVNAFIKSHPANVKISPGLGRAAAFSIEAYGTDAYGNPNLSYQWFKTSGPISSETNSVIVITNVLSSDLGAYYVVVSNTYSCVTSSVAMLSGNAAAVLCPDYVSTPEGTPVTFFPLLNDSDPDNGPQPLNWAGLLSSGRILSEIPDGSGGFRFRTLKGFLSPTNGGFCYAPDQFTYGDDYFDYVVSDGERTVMTNITIHIDDSGTVRSHNLGNQGLVSEQPCDGEGASREYWDGRLELNGRSLWGVGSSMGGMDSSQYECRVESGDFDVIARLDGAEIYGGEDGEEILSAAGLMIREQGAHFSRFAAVGVSETGNFCRAARIVDGDNTSASYSGRISFAEPLVDEGSQWLRIQRVGDRISTYVSNDGVSWQELGNPVVLTNLSEQVNVGLFSTACDGFCRAIFSSFDIKPIEVTVDALELSSIGFRLGVSGGPNSVPQTQASIQVSSNLVNWSNIGSIALTGTRVEWTNASAAQMSKAFYRVAYGQRYSVNSVGFVRMSAAPGFVLIANQLNRGSNSVVDVFGSELPMSTQIYKYNGSGYDCATMDSDLGGWDNPGMTVGPGEGVWISNPTQTNLAFAVIGEVPQGTLINSIPAGTSLRSSIAPQAGLLQTGLGYPAGSGDVVEIGSGAQFNFSTVWAPSEPGVEVGQSFWISSSSSKNWVRTLVATPDPFTLRMPTMQANESFAFKVRGGVSGGEALIEASTNLTSWQSIGAVKMVGGTCTFVDREAPNHMRRFYRVRAGQQASLNAVGFIRMSPGPGFTLIANQLNRGANTIVDVFGSGLPMSTQIYKYNGSGYDSAVMDPDLAGWDNPGMTIAPGEGVWISNPTQTNLSFVLLGEVPQGTLSNSIPAGTSIRSSMLPQAGLLQTDLGYSAGAGDVVEFGSGDQFEFGTVWSPLQPRVDVGQSFWINSSSSKSWTRRFDLWP